MSYMQSITDNFKFEIFFVTSVDILLELVSTRIHKPKRFILIVVAFSHHELVH